MIDDVVQVSCITQRVTPTLPPTGLRYDDREGHRSSAVVHLLPQQGWK